MPCRMDGLICEEDQTPIRIQDILLRALRPTAPAAQHVLLKATGKSPILRPRSVLGLGAGPLHCKAVWASHGRHCGPASARKQVWQEEVNEAPAAAAA
mmetsp:Transcript_35349/g.77305  ORF Transcript_35349/g.77305 Transcript_35349/m.77305 type:complete len:98 (-) Transcript_35349:19-312(-)